MPKHFFLHAALLGQASAHCRKFPTAASRRSLGRVSVPVWPSTLSGRLRIVALVGLYPANQLMRHKSILALSLGIFNLRSMRSAGLCGLSCRFQQLSPSPGQVTYVLLTRSPLTLRCVRLACIRHAASVHPEPGSNSPLSMLDNPVRLTLFSSSLSFDVSSVQFSMSLLRSPSSAYSYYHLSPPFVNTFFYFFLYLPLFSPLFQCFFVLFF